MAKESKWPTRQRMTSRPWAVQCLPKSRWRCACIQDTRNNVESSGTFPVPENQINRSSGINHNREIRESTNLLINNQISKDRKDDEEEEAKPTKRDFCLH
jgi:hypothetical protein